MKIDLIIGSLQSGGAERVVSLLANQFVKTNQQVRVVTFRNIEKYEVDQNVTRVRLHKNLLFLNYTLVRAFLHLLKFYRIKSNRPDIINSHIDTMSLATIPVALIYNIPIVVSEHFNHLGTKNSLLTKLIRNVLYKKASAITILTKFDYEYFRKKNNNVAIIPNPSSFNPIKKQNPDREKSILAVGKLDRYVHKGFDNLLDIAKKIQNKHPEWQFKIIGEGEHGRAFLENKIQTNGLENNVKLLGFRSDIDSLLQSSSIFILSSRHEGLPMVLIEAASQGIACISYDCISGPSDIIEHGQTGILVEDQNQDSMVQELSRLIKNSELRILLGSNAIVSSRKFLIDKIGLQWENLFKKVLNQKTS